METWRGYGLVLRVGRFTIEFDVNAHCKTTEIVDRLGHLKGGEKRSGRSCHILENVDTLQRIACHVHARHLGVLCQCSRHLRVLTCNDDILWRPLLYKLWRRVGRTVGRNADDLRWQEHFHLYLSRPENSCRSTYSIFAERALCRRRIRSIWDQVSKFAGPRSDLREGLDELEIFDLETRFGFPLPLALRELYELCDGEHPRWGNDQSGVLNGYRFLPLEEMLRNKSSFDHMPSRLLPLTELAGFAQAGDQYLIDHLSGVVFKASGASCVKQGDLLTFLASVVS